MLLKLFTRSIFNRIIGGSNTHLNVLNGVPGPVSESRLTGFLNMGNYYSTVISEERNSADAEPKNVKINPELISHLERTSLVGFGSEEAVVRLEEAIRFASVLYDVNTAHVKPMDSVLENEILYLRADETGKTSRKDIIMNAAIIDEDYFVAPPGNIPLEASKLAQDLVKAK